jgi:hypothetical protein
MKLLSAITVLFGALLVFTAGSGAAPAQPAPPIELAGRDCGGTSKAAAFGLSALPPATTAGWSNAEAVSTDPNAINQIAPAAAIDPQGRPVLVWQESTGRDGGDIVALPAGNRQPVRVDDTGNQAALQSRPTMALSPDGRIHVAWEDLRDGAPSQIYFAESSDGGLTWSANRNLTAGIPSRDHVEPTLFSAPDGSLFLAWRSNRLGQLGVSDILVMRGNGAAWSAPTRLNNELVNGARLLPRLAGDGQTGLLAVWEDQRGAVPAIYSARLADPAGAWSAETLASPLRTFAARPSLTAGPDGTLYLAYQGDPGIFVRSSANGGATWSNVQRVDDGAGDKYTDPQVIVDALGGVHCIWCQLQGDASIIAARSADGGASWGNRVALASTTGTTDPLGLATDARGRVFAFWADDRDNPAQRRLYSAAWQADELFLPLITR